MSGHAQIDTEQQLYRLVYDPTPIDQGGYRTGARFSAHEILCMLQRNPDSLPTGAILERGGQRYQVQLHFNHHDRTRKQRLVLLAD